MTNFREQFSSIFGGPSPSTQTSTTLGATPTTQRRKFNPPASIPSVKKFFLKSEPTYDVLCFQSKDKKQFSVELPVAMQMQYFRKAYESEDFGNRSHIEVDFVYGDILAYVLYFCMVKTKVEKKILEVEEAEGLCFGFAEKLYALQDVRTMHHILEAASSLEVGLLRDLLCEVVLKLLVKLSPEDVKEVFDGDISFKDPTRIEESSV